jgi:curved DNA-binding protein CbpA
MKMPNIGDFFRRGRKATDRTPSPEERARSRTPSPERRQSRGGATPASSSTAAPETPQESPQEPLRTFGHYETLGVLPTATSGEIKTAYNKAVLEWHPDKNRGNEKVATEKFITIKAAYEILSDPVKRRGYDFQARLNPQTARFYKKEENIPSNMGTGSAQADQEPTETIIHNPQIRALTQDIDAEIAFLRNNRGQFDILKAHEFKNIDLEELPNTNLLITLKRPDELGLFENMGEIKPRFAKEILSALVQRRNKHSETMKNDQNIAKIMANTIINVDNKILSFARALDTGQTDQLLLALK